MASEPQPDAKPGNVMVVRPEGALDASSVPPLRDKVLADIETAGWTGLTLDGAAITRLDGVGLGFLAELRSVSYQRFNRPLEIRGLPPTLQRLSESARLDDRCEKQLQPLHRPNGVELLGRGVYTAWSDFLAFNRFLGALLAAFWLVVRSPRHVRWLEFLTIAQQVGADALVILSLLGFLLGSILAFQTSVPLDRFGAIELVPTIVGIAILRELGPLIAAILVAGRSGAAFAAELGTMKVTEELSALKVMGLNPIAFLVVPRVLAMMLMLPFLTVYTDLMGVLGGSAVMISRGYSLAEYMQSVRSGIELQDATGGILKTIVFALLIAIAGCERGLATGPGPGAVGRSTTRAVVASIVLIIFADLVFGLIFYTLGI